MGGGGILPPFTNPLKLHCQKLELVVLEGACSPLPSGFKNQFFEKIFFSSKPAYSRAKNRPLKKLKTVMIFVLEIRFFFTQKFEMFVFSAIIVLHSVGIHC